LCELTNKKVLTSSADFRTIRHMTRKDIIRYYGSQAEAARRLGCKPQTIIDWELTGVPEGRQYQVELATRGKLRAAKPADRKAVQK
jgi:DNA-binding XRE family transcriptional regulator